MADMSSQERFTRMFQHREADRIPIIDTPWAATLDRWQREGMPDDADFAAYFGLDQIARITVDNSPKYPSKVIEETEDYIVSTTTWGVTLKNWKHAASTPEFLDFTITDRDSWEDAKARMYAMPDRIPWEWLYANYPTWHKEGYWIEAELWFGFDVTHSWAVGTERLLVAMLEDPEWCSDMFNRFLDVTLDLLDMVWNAGYVFHGVRWPDDMGYKNHQFFSLDLYRELLKPVHKRAIDWAHEKGIYAELHSCGDVNPLIPDLLEIGLDSLNPLEVKAGMDPVHLKRTYGDKLVLHGGINAALWDNPNAFEAQMREVLPVVKENGGYIFSSDHSIPSSVSLQDFQRIVKLAKELGSH